MDQFISFVSSIVSSFESEVVSQLVDDDPSSSIKLPEAAKTVSTICGCDEGLAKSLITAYVSQSKCLQVQRGPGGGIRKVSAKVEKSAKKDLSPEEEERQTKIAELKAELKALKKKS